MSIAPGLRIQGEVQLDRDQVEVGQTCQHSERLSARHIVITQHECRARVVGLWGAGWCMGVVEALLGTRERAREVILKSHYSMCKPALMISHSSTSS